MQSWKLLIPKDVGFSQNPCLYLVRIKPKDLIVMKKLFIALMGFLGVLAFTNLNAQPKWTDLDKSPMDVVYYPTNLPIQTTFRGSTDTPLVKIYYGRPQLNERTMLGSEAIPYGKMWRMGANEATEITLYKDATIGGQSVKAGTYTLYAIPNEDVWTVVFNSKLNTWGNYAYDEAKDVVRFDVPVKAPEAKIESLSMAILATDTGANWIIGWENAQVEIPVEM